MAVQLPNFASLGLDSPRAVGGVPQYPQESAVAAGEAQFGKGVEKLGLALSDIASYNQLHKDKVDSALATANLDGQLIPLKEQAKNETDPTKLDELQGKMQALTTSAGAGIGNPEARQLWQAHASIKVAEGEGLVKVQQHKVYNDRFLAGADAQLESQLRLAQQATDPADRETAQRNIGTILGSLTSAGVISETAAQKATQEYGEKIILGTTHWKDANGDPKGALDYLKQNAQHVNPTTLDSLSQTLQHRVDTNGVKTGINDYWGGTDKGYTGNRGPVSDPRGLVPYIKETAQKYGIDPDTAVQVAASEGLANPVGDGGKSGGAFQLYTGAPGAVGSRFKAETGLDPLVPQNEKATIDYALKTAAKEGWGAWNGAKRIGVRGFAGIGGGQSAGGGETQVADAGGTMTDAAPAQPAPITPHRDIDALLQRVQDDADSGKWSQEQANAIQAGLRSRYNHTQAAEANDRATLTRQLNNGAAMLADGREFNWNPAQIQHFFPKDKADEIIQQLQDAKEAGQITSTVRTSSPEDLVRQKQQLDAGMNDPNATDYAKRSKLLNAFQTAADQHFKALDKDPAAYVTLYSPNVAAKYQAIDPKKPETFAAYATAALAEQGRLGVQDEKRSILPTAVAASMAAKIAAIDPAKENPAAALDATARSYGAYWPQVFGDLVKAKLPGSYQVLATMDRPEQVVAAGDLTRALGLMAEKGGMTALKKAVPDDTQKAIDKGLDDALSDFRASAGTQAGGARLYATVRDASQALAYYYGFRGRTDGEAVRQAVDGIINAKYDFGTIDAGTVRVPKGSLSDVQKAAEVVKSTVKADQLGPVPGNPLIPPEKRKEIWLGAIQAGDWANNEDDSGLVLMGRFRDGSYSAVRRADGSRIELKFDSAAALAPYSTPGAQMLAPTASPF